MLIPIPYRDMLVIYSMFAILVALIVLGGVLFICYKMMRSYGCPLICHNDKPKQYRLDKFKKFVQIHDTQRCDGKTSQDEYHGILDELNAIKADMDSQCSVKLNKIINLVQSHAAGIGCRGHIDILGPHLDTPCLREVFSEIINDSKRVTLNDFLLTHAQFMCIPAPSDPIDKEMMVIRSMHGGIIINELTELLRDHADRKGCDGISHNAAVLCQRILDTLSPSDEGAYFYEYADPARDIDMVYSDVGIRRGHLNIKNQIYSVDEQVEQNHEAYLRDRQMWQASIRADHGIRTDTPAGGYGSSWWGIRKPDPNIPPYVQREPVANVGTKIEHEDTPYDGRDDIIDYNDVS